MPIRKERRFESYSRGPELIREIRKLWRDTQEAAFDLNGYGRINDRIRSLVTDFDLNACEWRYWTGLAAHDKER